MEEGRKFRKALTPAEIKQKIYAYCAYQERAHQEVKNKLYALGAYGDDVDDLITTLITEGYLNEERFAKAFAGGKFRVKHWGRVKINRELEARGLTKNCIKAGMSEIEDADYVGALCDLLDKKANGVKESDLFVKRDKVARFAISKGFEPELVWAHVVERIK